MIALEDFSQATPVPAGRPLGVWSELMPQRKLACTTAARLRQHLAADFTASGNWFTLCRALRRKGFCLKLRGGALWLYDAASQAALSSCEDLGFSLKDLVLRFGSPQPQRANAQHA